MDTYFMHLLLTLFIVCPLSPFLSFIGLMPIIICVLKCFEDQPDCRIHFHYVPIQSHSRASQLLSYLSIPCDLNMFIITCLFIATTFKYLYFKAQQRKCRHDINPKGQERSDDKLPLCKSLNSSERSGVTRHPELFLSMCEL